MITLTMGLTDTTSVPWANHPLGAGYQIKSCMNCLGQPSNNELRSHFATYKTIDAKPPATRSRQDAIFTAALCWTLKCQLLETYQKEGIPLCLSRYEDLVSNSTDFIKYILDYVGLPWHDNVLRHHQIQKGVSVGGTINERRIDSGSLDKWRKLLSADDLLMVESLCADIAQRYGYRFQD